MTLPLVTVTAGPSSTSVVSLAAVKTELGITGTGSDTKLTRLIRAAGAAMAGPHGLQRQPWRQTVTVQMPGYGGEYLPLPLWPAESVTSVALGSTTVTASSYSIAEPERAALYADDGWHMTETRSRARFAIAGDEELEYTLTGLLGGWIMPAQITDWAAATAYVLGDWVRSSDTSDLVRFELTTAGTSGATEPTWDTTAGNTTTDNTATWTARAAREMPYDLAEAGMITVLDWFAGGLEIPSGVISERFESAGVTYGQINGNAAGIPSHAQAMIKAYR